MIDDAERITDVLKLLTGNQAVTLKDGRDLFIALSFDEQVNTILSCISLLKSGRTGGCDLRNVGGKQKSGVIKMRANISSSKYEEICIVDYSPAGLHENKSINLKELLK